MKIKGKSPFEFPEDVARIQKVLIDHGHSDATSQDAEKLWELFSDSMAAGWLFLPEDDDEIYQDISYWIEE